MTKRKYTSINTIMEKSRKGELTTSSSFNFSPVKMFQKREVVKPYLHRLDDHNLEMLLYDYLTDNKKIYPIIDSFMRKTNNFKFDPNDITTKMISAVRDQLIPKHFINDLFGFYYTAMDRLDFATHSQKNQLTYKLLEKFNEPSLKILSNSNPLKAMVIIRAYLLRMLFAYAMKSLNNEPDAEDLFKELRNPSCGYSPNGNPGSGSNGAGQPGAPGNQQSQGGSGEGDGEDNNGDGKESFSKDKGKNQGKSQGAGKEQPEIDDDYNQNQTDQDDQDDQSEDEEDEQEPGDESDDGDDDSTGSENRDEDGDQDDSEGEDEDSDEFDDEDSDGQDDEDEDSGDPEEADGPDSGDQDDDADDEDQDDNQDDQTDSDYKGYDLYDEDDDPEFDPWSRKEDHDPSQGSQSAGASDGNHQSVYQTLDDLLSRNKGTKEELKFGEAMMDEARDSISMMDDIMDEGEMSKLWTEAEQRDKRDEIQLRTDMRVLNQTVDQLKAIRMDATGLKVAIKHLLDKTLNYFSAKEDTYFEHIFDADSLDGIMDMELLHPKIRKGFFDDVDVKETRRVGQVNVYVDISGSMYSPSGVVDDKKNSISCAQFAMALTLKLKEMNLLGELFVFDNRVHKRKSDLAGILSCAGDGGTEIKNVIGHIIEKTQVNSLIITDAQDYLDIYSELAYFIGVNGARFDHFSSDCLKQYVDNAQAIMFTGNDVFKIGYDGRPYK